MQDFPILETLRLWLCQATKTNAEAVFSIFSSPQVVQFNDLDTFTHFDLAGAVIERGKWGSRAIVTFSE